MEQPDKRASLAGELPLTAASSAIADCRLDADGLRAQGERYRAIGAHLEQLDRRPQELIARFASSVDDEAVRETLEVERACCPFFQIDFDPTARRLSVSVERPDQAGALAAIAFALSGREA